MADSDWKDPDPAPRMSGRPTPQDDVECAGIRAWLGRGGHNEPEMLAAAARRILLSGALTWER
jgi:hypothetical protein